MNRAIYFSSQILVLLFCSFSSVQTFNLPYNNCKPTDKHCHKKLLKTTAFPTEILLPDPNTHSNTLQQECSGCPIKKRVEILERVVENLAGALIYCDDAMFAEAQLVSHKYNVTNASDNIHDLSLLRSNVMRITRKAGLTPRVPQKQFKTLTRF